MVKSSSTPLHTLLGACSGASSTPDCSLWAFAVSRLKDSVYEDLVAGCIGLHQEGRGPAGVFGWRIVLEFGPGDGHVVLSPRPGYVPKVPTTPFRDQVVSLQALPLEEADPALALLCPVCALRLYTDWTQSLRTSDQLFVCYGGQQKGKAVSKQRMAHWIVDAIALAYQAQGVSCPLRLRAHSTRGVASSWALARGASLTDICRAAGWATPNTFARFYSLRVEPVSSRVLTSGQGHGEVPA